MINFGSPPDRYRPCVGILLLNVDEKIFVGERVDALGAWQMPQGGIDPDENVIEAAVRELQEETGIENALPIGIDNNWRTYILPEEVRPKSWGGKFIGQAQIWVAFKFTGNDADINVTTTLPEFSRWKWTDPDTLLNEIVSFKRDIYRDVLAAYPTWMTNPILK